MKRAALLSALTLGVAAVIHAQAGPFTVTEASIADLRTALEGRRVTSVQIVTQYLERIAIYEDLLHAALHVNRNALREAEQLDRERLAGRVRGPLHGIPIAVK